MASDLRDEAMLAIPDEFLPIRRLALPQDEWMAVLPDGTEVVIADEKGRPSALGIEKAISIVRNRSHLEARGRQLLSPLCKSDGEWRLVGIDFGVEAQHHNCEFLMCFVFQAAAAGLCATSPYVEVASPCHGDQAPTRCSS
ncbi:hypothetical protein [Variovorax sp. E3]|uniref:hypothetical protein n=1 Tax=Variovorax sp. E3 TaxID=1914993 RepID=UPI0018DE74ED|nr:hypothetical protein [Variovorax sp. E3]